MTLRELIQKSSHSAVFDIIRSCYYKGRNNEDLTKLTLIYRRVGEELISLPYNSNSKYKLYITEKECEGEKFIDVCLYNEDEDELYALDFSPWEDLIDLEIYKAVEMNNYTALAHILWETTFWGWTQDQVREEGEALLKEKNRSLVK